MSEEAEREAPGPEGEGADRPSPPGGGGDAPAPSEAPESVAVPAGGRAGRDPSVGAAPSESPEHRPAPRVLAGRYQLGERLGKGGAASVYRARDLRLGVDCAVKVLSPHRAGLRESLRRRLRAEARVMAQLRHPNILPVTDVGAHEGRDFVVMALAEGGSLAEQLRRDGPMSAERAVEVGLELLSALQAAHGLGVIHRDVKPQNLLLTHDGRVQLADFGIALIDDPEVQRRTRTGVAMGSMAFMAPEQRIDAARVTPAADLYATASTLFTLLTNRSPMDLFVADGSSPRWASVPRGLLPVLFRATRYAPEERFETADQMAAELRRCALEYDLPVRSGTRGVGAGPGVEAPSWWSQLGSHPDRPLDHGGTLDPTTQTTDGSEPRAGPELVSATVAPVDGVDLSQVSEPGDRPGPAGPTDPVRAGAVAAPAPPGVVETRRSGSPLWAVLGVVVGVGGLWWGLRAPGPTADGGATPPAGARSTDEDPRDEAPPASASDPDAPPTEAGAEPAAVDPGAVDPTGVEPEPGAGADPATAPEAPSVAHVPAPAPVPASTARSDRGPVEPLGPANIADAAPQRSGPAPQVLRSGIAAPAGQWTLNLNGRTQKVLRLVVADGVARGTLEARLLEARVWTRVEGTWSAGDRRLVVTERDLPASEVAAHLELVLDPEHQRVERGTYSVGRNRIPVAGSRDPETAW